MSNGVVVGVAAAAGGEENASLLDKMSSFASRRAAGGW